jgi:hypothetical protein
MLIALVVAVKVFLDIFIQWLKLTLILLLRAPPKITQLKNQVLILREIFDIAKFFHENNHFLMQKCEKH